ncbi:MAG: hypothetical protein RL763_915 [Pseudomonadota bacterium]
MAADGVVLFGADGQLGHALQAELALLGRLIPLTLSDVDIADAQALRAIIRQHAPRYIVNAAAYTAVDKAEQEPSMAHAINATAPGIMAEEAKSLGATLVHYSTDYVFNGRSNQPYQESDATDPLSVYGRTKRDGDLAVMAQAGAFFIFRSSWVVGAHGGNFLKTMLRLAQERDSLSVVADQGVTATRPCFAQRFVSFKQCGSNHLAWLCAVCARPSRAHGLVTQSPSRAESHCYLRLPLARGATGQLPVGYAFSSAKVGFDYPHLANWGGRGFGRFMGAT